MSERLLAPAPPSAPPGFCPRCDYPTAAGTCPECGHRISAGRLRRKPRSWMRRHAIGLVILPAAAAAAGWFAYSSPRMLPYFPTIYLLSVQAAGNNRSPAAVRELVRRYLAGELSAGQTRRFIEQSIELRWVAAELGGSYPFGGVVQRPCTGWLLRADLWDLTPAASLRNMLVEHSILGMHCDDQVVPVLDFERPPVGPFYMVHPRRTGVWNASSGYLDSDFIQIRLPVPDWKIILVETEITVSDPLAGSLVARWKKTQVLDPSIVIWRVSKEAPIPAQDAVRSGQTPPPTRE